MIQKRCGGFDDIFAGDTKIQVHILRESDGPAIHAP